MNSQEESYSQNQKTGFSYQKPSLLDANHFNVHTRSVYSTIQTQESTTRRKKNKVIPTNAQLQPFNKYLHVPQPNATTQTNVQSEP